MRTLRHGAATSSTAVLSKVEDFLTNMEGMEPMLIIPIMTVYLVVTAIGWFGNGCIIVATIVSRLVKRLFLSFSQETL
ncbi:unnamed protein product [Gongylonema pulchrum]|uniref:ABC transmembrane type-1 domain-containing protein n=1 Tax=Gongylonema pulchrum TaxID=637853 RepID=A0A183ERV8_9BILA|nr:unnamed protein product [Gongylonema pulchrum]